MTNLEKRLILLNSIFNFGATLVSMFITVYLYIYANSIPLMSLYIIFRIGCFPIFFILGNKISKKHSFTTTYAMGLSLITIALVITLFGGALFERNPYYILLVATIIGSGEGFYYFSANTSNQIISSIETRSKFLSFNGLFSNITSLLTPIFASFVLTNSKDEMSGYHNILYVIICVFIVVIGISLSMNKKSEDKDSSLKKAFDLKDKVWKDHTIAVIFYGFRNALELNTISILIYNAATNSNVYSKLQILFSFLTIISYYAIGKMLSRNNISPTFKTGVALKIIGLYFLIFMPTTTGAIIYGVSNALATVFYDNSYNFLSANIIGRYKDEMTARVVARETYLSFGRIVSMAFIILCFKILPETIYLQTAAIIISLSPIVVERTLIKYK